MENLKITSESFFKAWTDTVMHRKEKMLSIWTDAKEFTNYVLGSENSVIKEVARKIDLNCYPYDYYSLDAILYRDEDMTPGIGENQYWFRNITIAFEHENVYNYALKQEVSHLLITNSELKVLVTYPNDNYMPIFNHLHEIIKGSKDAKYISENENFLIIFGSYTGFLWEGYLFKMDEWKKI